MVSLRFCPISVCFIFFIALCCCMSGVRCSGQRASDLQRDRGSFFHFHLQWVLFHSSSLVLSCIRFSFSRRRCCLAVGRSAARRGGESPVPERRHSARLRFAHSLFHSSVVLSVLWHEFICALLNIVFCRQWWYHDTFGGRCSAPL